MTALRLSFFTVLLLASSMSIAQVSVGTLNPNGGSARATTSGANADAESTASPEQARALLQLLADERVVRWLQTELEEKARDADLATEDTLRTIAARRMEKLRSRASEVLAAIKEVPTLPGKLQRRWQSGLTADDSLRSTIYLLIFLFIGCGLEWLYWRYASLRLRQLELSNVAGLKLSLIHI